MLQLLDAETLAEEEEEAAEVPPPSRPRRTPRRTYQFDEDELYPSSASSEEEAPWVEDETEGTATTRKYLPQPAETAAAAFVERPPGHLFDLQTLVMNEDAFDVDGYSATFEGEQALEGLELRLPETHPMASMAANQPKARKLYDPASFGLMGLALPREHVGMGLAIQRNR